MESQAVNEEEEFEFRLRLEQEQDDTLRLGNLPPELPQEPEQNVPDLFKASRLGFSGNLF